MKNTTLVYTITWKEALTPEELSGLFMDLPIEGVEEMERALKVYVAQENQEELEVFLQDLQEQMALQIACEELEHKNWNEQWESSFQPIQIENFVLVRATFHPASEAVLHEIVIEPKMSFGTGHHPTTAQMMQQMRHIDFLGKNVLDCGSGTGILAILAEKLGAASCLALDNDEWCFTNCEENIQLNATSNVQPQLGVIADLSGLQYDIILANIHRNFLVEFMGELAALLKEDGYLLVSGFYQEDSKAVLDAALEHHLIAQYETVQHNWACILLKKNK